MSNSKPPIGVQPAWLCASQRISALAHAIARYADDEHGAARRFLIRVWADEIKVQLDIWDKFMALEEEEMKIREKSVSDKLQKQTNADRIRSMTDEELADYLRWHNDLYSRNGMDWLDWLKQEAKEEQA